MRQTAASPGAAPRLLLCPERDLSASGGPTGEGTAFELAPMMKPLEPFRDQLVAGERAEQLGGGAARRGRRRAFPESAAHGSVGGGRSEPRGPITSRARPPTRSPRMTLGKDTPLPSIELDRRSRIPGRKLRERLQLRLHELALLADADHAAADGGGPASGVRAPVRRSGQRRAAARADLRQDRSILDAVAQDLARLRARLGAADRTAVERVSRRGSRRRAAHPADRTTQQHVAAAGAPSR